MKKHNGFTLIELMVTVVILGMILSVAIPSFQSINERKTLPEVAKLMEKTIKLARDEARRRNTLITLSPLNTSWESGWQLTFVDQNTLTTQLIREFPPAPSTVSIASVPKDQYTNVNPIVFEINGQVNRLGSLVFTQASVNAVSNCTYTLNILISGMVQKRYSGC
jgi:type IV fimbrial biogenesis protein FimT